MPDNVELLKDEIMAAVTDLTDEECGQLLEYIQSIKDDR